MFTNRQTEKHSYRKGKNYISPIYLVHTVLCLGQDYCGTQVSLYMNFRGTFTPVKLNSYPEISVHFLFKFELDVDIFVLRLMTDDSEVVSAIALVLNSLANLLFLY